MSSFNETQHACEVVLAYVDGLMEQGLGRARAIDHAVQRYGIKRATLVCLVNDRDFGLYGDSGVTEVCCVASPGGLEGTA